MGMFSQAQSRTGSGSETIIGSSVKVEGKFVGSGNVIVEGKVSGSIHTDHDLQIVQGAVVHADVEAKNVVISGEVRGTIKAHETLELTPTAKVFGDVEGKTISVGSGAILNGKCTMVVNEQKAQAENPELVLQKDRSAKNPKSRPVEAL